MRILHVGAVHSPRAVDGVSGMVWLTATEQARLCEKVTLLLDAAPDDQAIALANESGLTLEHVQSGRLAYDSAAVDRIINSYDLVHMHSVFVPRHATLARRLARARIPYVITPHGGLSKDVLQRNRARKWVYSLIVERPRFAAAEAISVVVPGEEADVRAYIGEYDRPIEWIPNPVAHSKLDAHQWRHRAGSPPRVAFLGRFDVLHKGLDLLWDIARRLPAVQFDLYGTPDVRTNEWFARLRGQNLTNVHVHEPIYGDEKIRLLAEASMYLQTSRWEGFPLSIAEAMFIGLPVAVAERLNIGKQFKQHDLGVTFPADPDLAALAITSALESPHRLADWSQRARAFAEQNFTARSVARRFIDLYRGVLRSQPVDEVLADETAAVGVIRK